MDSRPKAHSYLFSQDQNPTNPKAHYPINTLFISINISLGMQEIICSTFDNAKNTQVVTFHHHGNNNRKVLDDVKQLHVGNVKAPKQFG